MIYIGSDHGGFDLKEKIKKWLTAEAYAWEDLGNQVYDPADDYPRFAFVVARKVANQQNLNLDADLSWKDRPKGILVCRSSAGMVIAANKIKGIRAVAVSSKQMAIQCRLHNDANVIALSGDWLQEGQVKEILQAWLNTQFSKEERHARRVRQIEENEG